MTTNHGFLLIDKPKGWTSFDVCGKLRKQLGIKKIGHTGTLDPFATGLLIVAVGKCTRLIPFLDKAQKTYVTEIALGQTSETLDTESEIQIDSTRSEALKNVSTDSIQQIIDQKFRGKIMQVPPKYSALKRNGKKLCDLARAGKEVIIEPRPAEVLVMKATKFSSEKFTVTIEMTVAAGFYVRSFARDLGEALGTTGMCLELRRTAIGDQSIDDAGSVEESYEPIDPKFLLDTIEHREIPLGRVQDFVAGRSWPYSGLNGEKYLILVGGKSLGVGEIIAGKLQPRIVL